MDMRDQADVVVTNLTEPPALVQKYKQTFFDFRRKYNYFIVGAIAALSMLPALRAGPGKLEKARVAARNFVVAGGGAAVLFSPEFVANTAAPAMSRAADRVQRLATQR